MRGGTYRMGSGFTTREQAFVVAWNLSVAAAKHSCAGRGAALLQRCAAEGDPRFRGKMDPGSAAQSFVLRSVRRTRSWRCHNYPLAAPTLENRLRMRSNS